MKTPVQSKNQTTQPKGRKVVFMITLRELQGMVGKAGPRMKLPTAKGLMTSGVPVVVKEVFSNDCEIEVYANGYVLYTMSGYRTVFALHGCNEYEYETVDEEQKPPVVESDCFLDERWYLRLILEGEDRLEHNHNNRIGSKQISYSAIAEDWSEMGTKTDVLDEIIKAENPNDGIKKITSLMTEKQNTVMGKLYVDGMEQSQVAEEFHITQQAVSDMVRKAKKRVQKVYSVRSEFEKVKNK